VNLFADISSSLLPKLPSKASTNLGAIQGKERQITNLPDQLRTQSLQRSGIICEPASQPADLS
jgi:hypothetical protein